MGDRSCYNCGESGHLSRLVISVVLLKKRRIMLEIRQFNFSILIPIGIAPKLAVEVVVLVSEVVVVAQ